MTDPQQPVLVDNMLLLRKEDFDDLLERAAERGAKRALADVGLDGNDAAHDIRELRGLLDAFNTAKHTAWQTVIKMVTTGFLLALVAGALIKLKVFGGAQWSRHCLVACSAAPSAWRPNFSSGSTERANAARIGDAGQGARIREATRRAAHGQNLRRG